MFDATGRQRYILAAHPLDTFGRGATSVAFSTDGKALASGGADGYMRLWDVASGTQLRELANDIDTDGAPLPVRLATFSPSGDVLAVASDSGSVTIWSTITWVPLRQLDTNSGNPAPYNISGLGISPDGKELATVGLDPEYGTFGSLSIWDIASSREQTRSYHSYPYNSGPLVWSPAGELLFVADGWRDWTEPQMTWPDCCPRPLSPVIGLTTTTDSQLVLTAHNDGLLRLWEPQSKFMLRRSVRIELGDMVAMALSADGKWLFTGHSDGTLKRWRIYL